MLALCLNALKKWFMQGFRGFREGVSIGACVGFHRGCIEVLYGLHPMVFCRSRFAGGLKVLLGFLQVAFSGF